MQKNLHPPVRQFNHRADKEKRLNQRSKVIWFTGLSGAGKTTLANKLEEVLFNRGHLVQVLDGDIIRSGINNNLGFTDEDRTENIRRIAEISKLFCHSGVITISAFISPTRKIRHMAMEIVGKEDFIEIYVNSPLAVCEGRDVKGLYAKAREGKIKDFTGISAPFEEPANPDLELRTDQLTVEESLKVLLEFVLPKIEYTDDIP